MNFSKLSDLPLIYLYIIFDKYHYGKFDYNTSFL